MGLSWEEALPEEEENVCWRTRQQQNTQQQADSEQSLVLASGPEGDILLIYSKVRIRDLALSSLHPARSPL